MNLVALIGNLCTDPEILRTPSGKSVCCFQLAVSRPGEEHADTFNIVTFDRQADICNEYLSVGRRVGIEGRLRFFDSRVEIVASRVQLLGAGIP